MNRHEDERKIRIFRRVAAAGCAVLLALAPAGCAPVGGPSDTAPAVTGTPSPAASPALPPTPSPHPTPAATPSPSSTVPDDTVRNGNLANRGYAAWDGEWVYFTNEYCPLADGRFYRLNPVTGEYQRLSEDPVRNIVLFEGYVYYINLSPYHVGNYITRCRPDGSRVETLVMGDCEAFWIDGGTLYYTQAERGGSIDEREFLYAVDPANPQPRYLMSVWRMQTVYRGTVYYREKTGDGESLMRVNADGTGKMELLDEAVSAFQIMGDRIYYSRSCPPERGVTPRNEGIHVMNLDGTGSRCLLDVYAIYSMNVTEEYIYYTPLTLDDDWEKWYRMAQEDSIYYNFALRGGQMMRMDLDGGNIVQLAEPLCGDIHILGDYLFYHRIRAEEFEPKLMKKDGTGYVTLPGVIKWE